VGFSLLLFATATSVSEPICAAAQARDIEPVLPVCAKEEVTTYAGSEPLSLVRNLTSSRRLSAFAVLEARSA